MSPHRTLRLAFITALLGAAACMCGEGGPDPDADGGRKDAGGPADGGLDAGQPDGGADAGPGDAGVDAGPEEPSFPYATGCRLPAEEAFVPGLGIEEAFPNMQPFQSAIFLTHAGDGSGRLFVVEQGGRIFSFDSHPDNAPRTLFLDLSDRLEFGGERGLLGLAFHPDFADNGTFFVSYTRREDTQLYSVISRIALDEDDETVGDPDSEEVLLEELQPQGNHNGGMIAFGPDGYLYIALGDGGGGGDPYQHGQDLETALGAILRIDVDNADDPLPYGIPADNPFAAGQGGARPEIWAYGLRNPWRFSFDRADGTLYAADVGQGGPGIDGWEEVNVIEAGKNYGWNIMEGHLCYPLAGPQDCDQTGLELPVAAYNHDVGNSITGGYVYRGAAVPALEGIYVFGDYVQRKLFLYDPATGDFDPEEPFALSPQSISSFGEDEEGELYVVGYGNSGRIYRVVQTQVPTDAGPFPATLAETGCFDDVPSLAVVEGVLPYEVSAPLWSDGSDKRRWLVLPEDGLVRLAAEGPWDLPVGTVLIKHFDLDTTEGDPSTRVALETRFLVVEEDTVRGYSYRWREDGSEADLLPGAATRDLQLTRGDAGPVGYTWEFPSRGQCLQCHTEVSGGVLGVETAQLNRAGELDGEPGNQLEALAALGLLEAPLPAPADELPRFFAPWDEEAGLAERARAYLHANCANCHQPGGPTGRDIDLRASTSLAEMNVCDEEPQGATLMIEDPLLVAPGDPQRSLLYRRMRSISSRMPPLATSLLDDEGSGVVADWIAELQECP